MTSCLICSPVCSQTIENPTDAVRIHKGWVAPTAGYFLTDPAMRDTISGWETARTEADIRQQALEALRDEVKAQQADLKRQLAALQTEIDTERRAWNSRVRRGKIQGIAYGLVIGFSTGYLVRRNNP